MASLTRAVARILSRTNRLEAAAARRQLDVLQATRKDLLRALGVADPKTFRTFHQTEVLNAIDREIARNRAGSINAAAEDTRAAANLGAEHVAVVLGARVADLSLVGVSPELVSAVVDVTTDQIRAVWSELGTSLKATVRRAALGVVDPYAAMTAVQKVLRDPKTFGSTEVRAEVIVRTELNRTFGLATDARMRQADARLGGGLKKYWLTQVDRRTRLTHITAGTRYAPGGNPGPIPVAAFFEVGKGRLLFPLDPRGPAEEVISCRCRSVPWVEDVTEAVLESWREANGPCLCAA